MTLIVLGDCAFVAQEIRSIKPIESGIYKTMVNMNGSYPIQTIVSFKEVVEAIKTELKQGA